MALQKLSLNDENTRKIRKILTRNPDGTFQVCETHERRMRAADFDVMIVADPESGEVSVHATANISCGHSKKPCTDSRTLMIANGAGINPDVVKRLSLVSADDKEESNAA